MITMKRFPNLEGFISAKNIFFFAVRTIPYQFPSLFSSVVTSRFLIAWCISCFKTNRFLPPPSSSHPNTTFGICDHSFYTNLQTTSVVFLNYFHNFFHFHNPCTVISVFLKQLKRVFYFQEKIQGPIIIEILLLLHWEGEGLQYVLPLP